MARVRNYRILVYLTVLFLLAALGFSSSVKVDMTRHQHAGPQDLMRCVPRAFSNISL